VTDRLIKDRIQVPIRVAAERAARLSSPGSVFAGLGQVRFFLIMFITGEPVMAATSTSSRFSAMSRSSWRILLPSGFRQFLNDHYLLRIRDGLDL